jgi:hypothetical protein
MAAAVVMELTLVISQALEQLAVVHEAVRRDGFLRLASRSRDSRSDFRAS